MTTSKDFFQAWLNVVNEPNRLLTLKSNWFNNKEYTNEIITKENSVIEEVGNILDFKIYERNYYSLDAIFYNELNKVPKINSDTYWFKDIEIAFEHENTFNKDLYQEVAHLLITRCNMRVLVTYPNNNEESVLDYLHEIISSCDIAKEISKKENFLIILGYYQDGNCKWKGQVYINTKEKWKPLNN